MKKIFVIVVLVWALLLTGCGGTPPTNSAEGVSKSDVPASTDNVSVSVDDLAASTDDMTVSKDELSVPIKDCDLFAFFLESWKSKSVDELYDYLTDDIKDLIDLNGFKNSILGINEVFGDIRAFSDEKRNDEAGMQICTCKAEFDNATVRLNVTIYDGKVAGYQYEIEITNSFDHSLSEGITEHYFSIESGKYNLNAVYTDSGIEGAPAVLLIPGSGPSDYNETVGLLAPFKDIANMLAENGINSLRMEKRTLRYASEFVITSGLKEEYYDDYEKAYEWLVEKSGKENVFLLGHSLGAQVGIELAEMSKPAGIILLNGSARHLADTACDQLCSIDSANIESYKYYAELAKSVTPDNTVGAYYYGASDYYWAEYNKLTPIQSLDRMEIPILIINSSLDAQVNESDIEGWKELEGNDNVTVVMLNNVSHTGYVGDISSEKEMYKEQKMSDELILLVAKFIKQ